MDIPVELAPRPTRAGWERRLRKDVARALPLAEEALLRLAERWVDLVAYLETEGPSCGGCGRPWGHSDHAPFGDCPYPPPGALEGELRTAVHWLREELARGAAMVHRPTDDPHGPRVVEAQHARLLSLIVEEGLDLGLACSKLGLSKRTIAERMGHDPFFAEQVRMAEDRGTITLLETLVKAARGLPVSRTAIAAAQRLLECRDPKRFLPAQRVEITERQILDSPALAAIVERIVAAIPPGHTCPACGGCECRRRVAEELGGGR